MEGFVHALVGVQSKFYTERCKCYMIEQQTESDVNLNHDYLYGYEAEMYAFYKIPKVLIENVLYAGMSAEAKLLYAIFLDRASLSASNGWKDVNGRIYIIYQIEDIMRVMGCGNQKAVKILAELENKFGLIERKKQGFCKPNLIYVKSVSRLVLNSHSLECENHMSGGVKITSTEVLKSHTNNTNINNTDFNNTNPILSADVDEELYKREVLMKYFDKHLEIDQLKKQYPMKQWEIDEIVEVILDTVCSKRKHIRIAGDDKPISIVHSQFMKLEGNHIRYVLDVLEKASEVRNVKQYILAALYNASMTMNHYYTLRCNNIIEERSL